MSIAELKEQIAGLSAKERSQIAAFLSAMELDGEAEFRAKVSRRMNAMDAGQKATAAQLERRHSQLKAKGR